MRHHFNARLLLHSPFPPPLSKTGYIGERADQIGSRVPWIVDPRYRARDGVSSRVRGEEPWKSEIVQLRGRFTLRPQDRRLWIARVEEACLLRGGSRQEQLRVLEG